MRASTKRKFASGSTSLVFRRAEQAVTHSSAFATRVSAGEQIVTSADDHPAQRALDWQVVDFEPAVIAITRECLPPVQGVEDRPTRIGFVRERFQRCREPRMEVLE